MMTTDDIELLKGLISLIKVHNGRFSDDDIKLLKGIYHIVNSYEEPERWITVKGNHIPIFKGQTEKQAIEKFPDKKQQTVVGIEPTQPMDFHKAGSGVNPNYKKGGKYTTNCQSCILVLAARLKGYNIQAKAFDINNIPDNLKEFARSPNKAFFDPKTGENPEFINTQTISPSNCKKWLENNLKTGALYAFGFYYYDGTKHIMTVYKQSDGNIEFFDPQDNSYMPIELLDFVLFDKSKTVLSPKIFRIDDKELDYSILNQVSEPAYK